MSNERAPWDFGYAPVVTAAGDDDGIAFDVIIATRGIAANEELVAALRPIAADVTVETLLARTPIFWFRARAEQGVTRSRIDAALRRAGIALRYVASARRHHTSTAPPFDDPLPAVDASEWVVRPPSMQDEPLTNGRWFLNANDGGIAVDRHRFGGGSGTRLAVIDNEAFASDQLDLEREVLVLVDRASRSQVHGSLMVAWAVGCGQRDLEFRGVAPDASPRLYLIPKPNDFIAPLPIAIVLAVLDGADVVVCSTYVEGSTSPMLDDALEVALRLGRGGRGTLVVLPTGREASSPAGSLHASFSLGFGEPASDPRVFCIGPSARGQGWFLWKDRKGRSRPLANRGPSVRWLAPGDDMAYPFRSKERVDPGSERLFHAESSGASAVAAGALLLVLAQNPTLLASEVDDIVTRTLEPVLPREPGHKAPFADPSDLLPMGLDRDGHNAKHGYGRIHAARACAVAADPISLALVMMGEDDAAFRWHDLRIAEQPYSREVGWWGVRALLADRSLLHGVLAFVRHARLVAGHDERQHAHGSGALLRHLAVLLHGLVHSRAVPCPTSEVAAELGTLQACMDQATRHDPSEILGSAIIAIVNRVFARGDSAHANT